MRELHLGRTPIREALQRLALENLVVILPRRGTIVADLNMSDLQKIFEMRLELEIYAVHLAAERATPAEVAEMEALLAKSDEIIRQADSHQLMQLDHQAHQLLARAATTNFWKKPWSGCIRMDCGCGTFPCTKSAVYMKRLPSIGNYCRHQNGGRPRERPRSCELTLPDFQTQLTAAL